MRVNDSFLMFFCVGKVFLLIAESTEDLYATCNKECKFGRGETIGII